MAGDIVIKVIDGEIEGHIAHRRTQYALEQLVLPDYLEIARIGKVTQVVQLLHHHLLHHELIDDLLFHLALGHHLVHVEVDVELLLFLQMADAADG